MLRDYTKIM